MYIPISKKYSVSILLFFKDPNADTQWNDQLRRFNIIGQKEEIKTEEERLEITRGKKQENNLIRS
jgi:hypothetical protein